MPVFVAPFIVDDLALPVSAARDDGDDLFRPQSFPEAVRVIAFVRQKIPGPFERCQKAGRRLDVGDVAGGQGEREGAAQHIGQGMDLGGVAAARGADALRLRPPFPPKAERCALT